jgi:capsid protein
MITLPISRLQQRANAIRERAHGAAIAPVVNQFDGSNDNSQRSSTVYFPLDSRMEIRPHDRREMVKKHRSLRNNLGAVKALIDTIVRLSIGWGLQPVPKSPDKDFNRRALAYWKRNTKSQNFDVSGQDREPAMQRLVLRETITDGEIFGIKVFDAFGKPQRQLIKTEQIGDPPGKNPTDNWQDGILCNSLGRPLKYCVLRDATPQNPYIKRGEQIDARDILHVYNRERAHQRHGLPWGYTGLNHGVDILDIAAFEKIAHKLNTAIVGSITTPTGEAPASMKALLQAATEASAAGSTRDTADAVKHLDLHGTSVPIFKTGEGMNLFLQGRNSINTTEFAGWLIAQYALGLGLHVDVVTGMMQGGTAVRGLTELSGRFFEEVQTLMVDDWNQPNWENVIGTALLADAYPKDYPGIEPLSPPQGKTWEGWDSVEWRGPKNITHDRGRDGKLYLEQIRAGVMTHEEFWTANDENPEEMQAKATEEVRARLDAWIAAKLPEEMFWRRELGQNGMTQQPSEPAKEPAQD